MEETLIVGPISAGMLVTIGKVTVGGIYQLAKQIHQTMENYELNEEYCTELNDHVYEVVNCLKSIPYNRLNHESFRQPISNLHACFGECWNLTSEYSEITSIERFLRASHYQRLFEKLKTQLVDYKDRLTFAMNVQNFVITTSSHVRRNTRPQRGGNTYGYMPQTTYVSE
ncbi:unnamed protein product [Adineta ricciae]|uniref:Mixed lineage kinase domain-containing protein n=1 Tax=Adineta ricciae TaxID=249248 RepID=A0A815R900_ADIRI|nr:unnamed protein product [Adineta ricciae]CAF1473385.1 unnamed protein product [Adineta ricciae]